MRSYNRTATITLGVERNEEEVVLEITGHNWYRASTHASPPEGDTKITLVALDGKPWDGHLTDSEEEQALGMIFAQCLEDEDPYDD